MFGSVFMLGGGDVCTAGRLVVEVPVEVFVTGPNVNTGVPEDGGEGKVEEGGLGDWGCVTRDEKTKGAFGIDAGAVVVPVKEAKTKAGQQT